MPDLRDILDRHVDVSPDADIAEVLKLVPAKWAVYLFADAEDRPIQLLCVRSLRDSLKRRLGGEEPVGPSRRVNYRDIVRRVHFRRVDSAFEADWVYLETARRLFPESYQGMVGFRPAWFVQIDPSAEFPRYKRVQGSGEGGEVLLGPVEDKHAAARLIELAEDAFDLCRYYNVLIEAPRGKACAYKEMGRCPAPCDGSITMEQYREMVRRSAEALVDPAAEIARVKTQMQQAAAALQFEQAAKLKARLEQLGKLRQGAFRHVRRLADFRYVSVQRGPRTGTARVFVITPGQIAETCGLIEEPKGCQELLRYLLRAIACDMWHGHLARVAPRQRGTNGGLGGDSPPAEAKSDCPGYLLESVWAPTTELSPPLNHPLMEGSEERLALASHHLFAPRNKGGSFIHADELDEKALCRAFRELRKQKDPEPDGEGVMKELQAM